MRGPVFLRGRCLGDADAGLAAADDGALLRPNMLSIGLAFAETLFCNNV